MVQQNAISGKVGDLEKGQEVVGFGWKSQEFTCSHDTIYEALQYKARNPDKFFDVTNVKVTDEPGYMSRTMTIKVTGKTVSERIILNPTAGEVVFQPLNPETGRLEHHERVIAVHDEPNHLEFYERDVALGFHSDPIVEASHDDLWKALVSAARDPY